MEIESSKEDLPLVLEKGTFQNEQLFGEGRIYLPYEETRGDPISGPIYSNDRRGFKQTISIGEGDSNHRVGETNTYRPILQDEPQAKSIQELNLAVKTRIEKERILNEEKADKPDRPSPNSYKLNCQKFLLTYKYWLPKPDLEETLHRQMSPLNKKTGRRVPIKEILIAHETGKKGPTPYKHTHVYIDLGKRSQKKGFKGFEFKRPCGEIVHPNVKKVKTVSDAKRVKKYVAKEDPSLAEFKEEQQIPLIERVTGCENIDEVLLLATRASDVFGLKEMWKHKPVEKKMDTFKPKGWQKKLLKKLAYEADPRTINWWWEPDGKCGKTQLCKWLVSKYPDKFYAIADPGKTADIVHILTTALDNGWSGHCVLVNLSRSFRTRTHIYQLLEVIKDGLMTSTKYSGRTILINNPHIVVFANYPPSNVDDDQLLQPHQPPQPPQPKLSIDRLKIYRIPKSEIEKYKSPIYIPKKVINFELSEDDDDEKDDSEGQ